MAGDLPLSAVLSQLLIALTIELDNEYEHRSPSYVTMNAGTKGFGGPWLVSYAMYAHFLRLVPDSGIRMADLATAAGYGRPVHPGYHGLRRWGYATYTPDIAGSSPKQKDAAALVRLTLNGRDSRDRWGVLRDEYESTWMARGLGPLRDELVSFVEQLDGFLPEFFPLVGFDRRLPALHEPASRPPTDLGLLELLSQAVAAITYDFDARSDVSLGTCAAILRPLSTDPIPVRDLQTVTGIARKEWGSAMSQLERAGFATTGTMPGTKVKTLALTAAGARLQESYPALLAKVESNFAHGEAVRAAAEPWVADALGWTTPKLDCWRAKTKTPRALAHFPLVMHRGGYPDGS